MKKGNVIVTKLARGAATTVAATALVANSNASDSAPVCPADDLMNANLATEYPDSAGHHTPETRLVWSIEETPNEWDKKLEQEFRKLALLEVKGTLTSVQVQRLNQLNRWRDEILCAPSADEMLLLLKRDNLLARMEKLLREYVEFKESANQQRASSQ